MTYTSWSVVFGEQPSATKWNLLGSNDASFNDGTGIASMTVGATTSVTNSYKFFVYRNAALNSANSFTVVAYDTKVYDTGTNVDVVTNKGRFTAPVTGYYWLSARAANTTATNTRIAIELMKNGSAYVVGASVDPSQAATENSVTVTGIVQLNASEYAEAAFIGGSGSVMSVGSSVCWFQGSYLSAG